LLGSVETKYLNLPDEKLRSGKKKLIISVQKYYVCCEKYLIKQGKRFGHTQYCLFATHINYIFFCKKCQYWKKCHQLYYLNMQIFVLDAFHCTGITKYRNLCFPASHIKNNVLFRIFGPFCFY